MQGVERLAMVCKVLFDVRLLELRREHEALKQQSDALRLKVFWLHHDDLKLKQHLAWANDSDAGPQCCCDGCYTNGRFDFCDPDSPKPVMMYAVCKFIPWFETQIMPFGLTSSAGRPHDVTTHFAMDECGEIDFARWFLDTPTCAHPDMRKVHDLFAYFARLGGQIEQPGLWESFWT
jgi:hypothetical protein